MLELTPQNAADYLRQRGVLAADEIAEVSELSGGVSNTVLLVRQAASGDFVLKQALPKLKVQQEWLCSIERISREVEVLRICGELLRGGTPPSDNRLLVRVPEVLFSDADNFCYAMTAAPADHQTWKQLLLRGETSQELAAACGRLLGTLHAGSWKNPEIATALDDRTFFDDLRLDPYYRRLTQVHPDLAPVLTSLIDETYATRLSLVHGDYSPKNLLVSPGELWLIDFEVGHFGDPAFDLGFFLTHLALKAFWAGPRADEYLALIDRFWESYRQTLTAVAPAGEIDDLSRRTARHWAACLLARIDGKSPVDYLTPELQHHSRSLGRKLILQPVGSVEEFLATLQDHPPW